MAAFPFLKKKQEAPKAPEKEKPLVQENKEEVAQEKVEKQDVKKPQKTTSAFSTVLVYPHITEKATFLAERGQYVFRVEKDATKKSAAESIENFYNVDVRKIRMVHIPAKKIRVNKREGLKGDYKKVIVTLKKGQTIEGALR